MTEGRPRAGALGVWRGAALYVGSLIGPGVLLLPALAFQEAGPASVVAWALLLVLSAPLAYIFAILAMRMPVTAGVSAYVERGLGRAAGAVTGGWFVTAVLIGAPAVSLIGGYYVSELTNAGTSVAATVGLMMFAVVLVINMAGLQVSSRLQLVAAAVLTLVIAVAVAAVLPSHATLHWTPFAPHGWAAVGTAASILVWLFVGWEAVAQLAADFERPSTQLPRAMLLAFVVVTVLYIGLASATVGVSGGAPSRVPLADLIALGFGPRSRDATAVLAVALTMATMNVYMASASKLAASLAVSGSLPSWLAGDVDRTIPRRPLLVIGVVGVAIMAALVAGIGTADHLVRATSACFVMVYVAVSLSAVRLLAGTARVAAVVATVLTTVVAAFSGWFLLVPAVALACCLLIRRSGGLRQVETAPGTNKVTG